MFLILHLSALALFQRRHSDGWDVDGWISCDVNMFLSADEFWEFLIQFLERDLA